MKNSFTLFTIAIVLSFSQVYAQSTEWMQSGSDIDGVASEDHLGTSVSISGDGTIMAVGANDNDGNGDNSGSVSIYKFDGTEWQQLGSTIYGDSGDNSGCSISLSDNGLIVAIGAIYNGGWTPSGTVRIYQYDNNSGTWLQLGDNINGEVNYDYSGLSVSLSADGTVVAIGARDNDDNGNDAGHVRVFKYYSNAWQQIGADIDGDASEDLLGTSVSISDDGTILAVGAPKNDGFATDAGQVKVFKYDGVSWNQLGADIYGKATNNQAGESVSLSSDGNTVALTAPYSQNGEVLIFSYSGTSWVQLGDDIPGGSNSYLLSQTISINFDGSVVAVGSPNEDPDNDDSNKGQVCIYNYDNDTKAWIQVANTIKGESASDGFGNSVCINNEGSVVVAGAPWNDAENSSITYNCGHARTFQLAATTKIKTIKQDDVYIYPNPTNGIIKINSEENKIQKITIINITGETILIKSGIQSDDTIDLSDFKKGIYIIRIKTDNGFINKKIIKR